MIKYNDHTRIYELPPQNDIRQFCLSRNSLVGFALQVECGEGDPVQSGDTRGNTGEEISTPTSTCTYFARSIPASTTL
jgi:hypothetical protein